MIQIFIERDFFSLNVGAHRSWARNGREGKFLLLVSPTLKYSQYLISSPFTLPFGALFTSSLSVVFCLRLTRYIKASLFWLLLKGKDLKRSDDNQFLCLPLNSGIGTEVHHSFPLVRMSVVV